MPRSIDEIRQHLAALDPYPDDRAVPDRPPSPSGTTGASVPSAHLATSDAPTTDEPTTGTRLAFAAVAAALLVVVVLVVTRSEGSTEHVALLRLAPAADAVPAREHLLALAERAERQPEAFPRDAVRYLLTAGWSLSSSVSGSATVSRASQALGESWVGADGTQSSRRSPGPPIAGERVVQIDPDLRPDASEPIVARLPARPVGATGLGDLSDLLLVEYRDDAPEPYRSFAGFVALAFEQPLRGDELAVLYRALADLDGIDYRGPTTDRAGRPGIAFSVSSDYHGLPADLILVVDPETGQPRGREEILTEDPGRLDVEIPGVLSYGVVLEAGATSEAGVRPG